MGSLSLSLVERGSAVVRSGALPQLVYLSVVATAFTNWLQTVGQREMPAERAAIIYALDPVWGAAFAYLFIGETLGARGIAGASLITAAAVATQGLALVESRKDGSKVGAPADEDAPTP